MRAYREEESGNLVNRSRKEEQIHQFASEALCFGIVDFIRKAVYCFDWKRELIGNLFGLVNSPKKKCVI